MSRKAFLADLSPMGKLLLLLGLILLFSLFTALTGLLIGRLWLGVSITELAALIANPESAEVISFVKFYQLLNQIGIFILPVIAYLLFVSPTPTKDLELNRKPTSASLLIAGLLVFAILPFLNYLNELNQQFYLPEFLSGLEEWMHEKETQATKLTEVFLATDNIRGLMVNIFIVALVPAIGEELLFRGVLLKLIKDWTNNVHIAIIISAFVFSAVHLQFYSFLPRFLLGLMLGYIFIYTQNLWVPIFLHFVNNAASVIVYYLFQNGYLKVSMEDFGASANPVYIVGSLLASLWLMTMLYQKEGRFIK